MTTDLRVDQAGLAEDPAEIRKNFFWGGQSNRRRCPAEDHRSQYPVTQYSDCQRSSRLRTPAHTLRGGLEMPQPVGISPAQPCTRPGVLYTPRRPCKKKDVLGSFRLASATLSTNPFETGESFPPERPLLPYSYLPLSSLEAFKGVEIKGSSDYRCDISQMLSRSSHWDGTTDLLDAFFIPDVVLQPSAVCDLGHNGFILAGTPNGRFSAEHIPDLQGDPLEGRLFFCRFDERRIAREWYWRAATIDELTAKVGHFEKWVRFADNLE